MPARTPEREQRNARHRLKALLLRNGIAYAGKTAWTAAHLRWLATLKLEHSARQIGFQEYLHAITESGARIARLEHAMRQAMPEWSLKPLVQALQALRGVQLIASMALVAELQDFVRFENARQLMAYVGLVPGGGARAHGLCLGHRAGSANLGLAGHQAGAARRATELIAESQKYSLE